MFFKKKDEETSKKGLVTRVGHSENKDAFACGSEAAGMADLCCASLGLIFTSCVLDQKEVLKGVRSVSGAPVIGCTSSAAICTNDGYFNSADGYTGIMSFGGNVTVGVAGHAKDKDAREMGRELAREAMKKAGKKDIIVSCHSEDPTLVPLARKFRTVALQKMEEFSIPSWGVDAEDVWWKCC